MSTLDYYTKGAKVWIPHPEKVWESAELIEPYEPQKKTLRVVTQNNETKTLAIADAKDLPFLRNPAILIGEDDLTALSYLHEPAVLHNLEVRFCRTRKIYTYCGIVLVAINPYDDLPIYDADTIQIYRGKAMGDLDPHIFAVAEEAYTKLEREQRDQSIIISGESGAGKTVSAKYTMRYFATVGGNANETQIEKKVLSSSPIMEALGNAKTTRNDNSSRFGKFIELQFSRQYGISGASIRTYLLEKSRVVFQADGERNYHIFYQLCDARDELPHLHLDHQNEFRYLNQGSSAHVDGFDDKKTFRDTVHALNVLGFSEEDKDAILKIIAAILHLGNVQFVALDQETSAIATGNNHLEIMCHLLEINADDLENHLTTRKIVSAREIFTKPMSAEAAAAARDALAKHVYAELFNWIVLVVNKALESSVPCHKFIGVLDIYGFETFETNSFEQFCINYANEKLQQQFNVHVFKLEQEEYLKEGIEWKMIDFYDNQPCIDLIETKLGVLDLLDEECRMPRGTDASWTEKLYSKCSKYTHFGRPRFGASAFTLKHFADTVQYESIGFLEKNRDTVIDEQVSVLKQSKMRRLSRLFGTDAQKLAPPGAKIKISSAKPAAAERNRSNKQTVGSQFRDSLNRLMATLNSTTPYYVRCIKPNDDKKAFVYNPKRAVQQLRACGVLETIRLSAAGFPSRWGYVDFFHRYRVLCKFKDVDSNDVERTCRNILALHIKNDDRYQFGRTKIFFRAAQVAFLEKVRAEKLHRCCVTIQKTVRAFICRKRYLKMQKSALLIQRYARGLLTRRLAERLRQERAAITIQRYARGWMKRRQYRRLQNVIFALQSRCRGYLARLKFRRMEDNAKAITIQRYIRGYLARKHIQSRLKKIILCQAAARAYIARRLYRKMKIEARSLEHVKHLNRGLENKIISLQQKLDESAKSNAQLAKEAAELRAKTTTLRALEIETRNLKTLLIEKNKHIDKIEGEKTRLNEEREMFVNKIRDLEDESRQQRDLWNEEMSKLRRDLQGFSEIARLAEEERASRIEEEKMLLLNEQDSDRQAYQKLLMEYRELEQYCEHLERKEQHRSKNGTHERNPSSTSLISVGDSFVQDDAGYASTRSNTSLASSNVKEGESTAGSQTPSSSGSEITRLMAATSDDAAPQPDVGLVLKLQNKIAELERERARAQRRIDELEGSPRVERYESAAANEFRVAELEIANSKMKSQIMELQNSINDGEGTRQLGAQLMDAHAELERRAEEIVQLKGVLANQTENMRNLVNGKTRVGEYVNEDGELALAYETQKTINKQLELEIQDEKERFKTYEKEYKLEIERLREDNERQQRILANGLKDKTKNQSEEYMSSEITRLTKENLELHDKIDALHESNRKLKRQLKSMLKKFQERGYELEDLELDGTNRYQIVTSNSSAAIKKPEGDYLGMFAYPSGKEDFIMKKLVINLRPRTAVTLLPCLPAYVIFMCIRHTDYTNDEEKVKSLISAFNNAIKKLIKKKQDDFETNVLWLANTLKLLHIMKQYSGDPIFQTKNTPKQNEQCLKNFDLSEYRQVLADTGIWIYNALTRIFCQKIKDAIIAAVLEHEEIQGISVRSGKRRKSSASQQPVVELLQELTQHHKMLTFYGTDVQVISQVVKQIFYFISATSLNNLLLRQDLCHWSQGLQIRHNLSYFENWCRGKDLDEPSILANLQPIVQAAHLLQARKTKEDVNSICDMCNALTPGQICKILSLYTPIDEFEVASDFLPDVRAELERRNRNSIEQKALLMDVKFQYPVKFPFNPSDICLEKIDVPDVFDLAILEKI